MFITPGYLLDKDKLIYLKAGFSDQSIESMALGDASNSVSLGKADLNGYVLGLGYKQIIVGGLYGFGEGNWYDYAKISANFSVSGNTISRYITTPSNAYSYTLIVGAG